MREIKFRAWDEELHEFVDINNTAIDPTNGDVIEVGGYELLDVNHFAILEQFTGIKDKNGVEIYEGDIVQHVRAYEDFPEIEPTKIGLPIVVNSGSYVYGKWIAREINKIGFGVNDYQFSEELQVVGNVHENADLLEE